MNPVFSQFRTEIRQFFQVSLLNLVFAAIAIAIGVQYIVTAILGQSQDSVALRSPVVFRLY